MIEYCPVCGWGPFEESYKSFSELRSSYDICDCCGCEFGYDDDERHYEEWVKQGCEWFEPKEKPKNWKPEIQAKNIIRPWPPK